MCGDPDGRRALEISGCEVDTFVEAKRPKVSVYVFGFILPECPGNSRKSDKTAAKSDPGIIMPKPGQTAENSKNAEMTKISDVEKET